MNEIRPTTNRRTRRSILVAIAAIALFGTSCGDDDADEATAAVSQPTNVDTPSTAAAPEPTPGGDAQNGDFCQAALAAERAAATEDTAAIEPAFDAVAAAAPADIKPAVNTVIAEAMAGDEDSPEFGAAYGELINFVKGNCGFATLGVTASEYAFGGVADTLDAGPTVIDFENAGQEFHQLLVMHVNDDVIETVDELLALPEAEAQSKMAPVGGAFAAPGATSYAMIDFQPGRYIAVCFLPTGATPENMPQIESGEHHGAPHHTQGMIQEFTVS